MRTLTLVMGSTSPTVRENRQIVWLGKNKKKSGENAEFLGCHF